MRTGQGYRLNRRHSSEVVTKFTSVALRYPFGLFLSLFLRLIFIRALTFYDLCSFIWEPVTFLIRSGVPRDDRDDMTTSLARLGIKSSRVWSDQITHVVFSAVSYPYDFKILAALVHGVHLVSPAWLRYVAQRGNASIEDGKEVDSENFQMTFQGLEEEAYRPDGAGLQAWAPNRSRKTLFCNIRFLFITVTDVSIVHHEYAHSD